MNPNPLLGIFLHGLGGFAAGSFYFPLKKITNWAWETFWIINAFVGWIVMPWFVASLTIPELTSVFSEAPRVAIYWTYFLDFCGASAALPLG